MNIDEFSELVMQDLLRRYEEQRVNVHLGKHTITKNNGIKLTGIHVSKDDTGICPTIYLDGYLDEWKQGRDFELIMDEIYEVCQKRSADIPFHMNDYLELSEVKDHIIYRLVNYKMNEESLKETPYLPFHDLAITFRFVAHRDDTGISTIQISNEDLKRWDISVSTLFQLAASNTPRLFPCKLQSMISMLAEQGFFEADAFLERDPIEDIEGIACLENGLYVATNRDGINGATVILYPNVLEECAKIAGGSIYLLPASIHEFIFFNNNLLEDQRELKEMVREANNTVVSPTEVLSENIYFYDQNENIFQTIK